MYNDEDREQPRRAVTTIYAPGTAFNSTDTRVAPGDDANTNLAEQATPLLPGKLPDDDKVTYFRGIDESTGRTVVFSMSDEYHEPKGWLPWLFWNSKHPLGQKFPWWIAAVFGHIIPIIIDEANDGGNLKWFSLAIRIAALVAVVAMTTMFAVWVFAPRDKTIQRVRNTRTIYLFELYIASLLAYAGIYASIQLIDPDSFSNFDASEAWKGALRGVYFSTVIYSGVGFGFISPQSDTARFVVWTQIILFIFYVVSLFAVGLSELRTPPILYTGDPDAKVQQIEQPPMPAGGDYPMRGEVVPQTGATGGARFRGQTTVPVASWTNLLGEIKGT